MVKYTPKSFPASPVRMLPALPQAAEQTEPMRIGRARLTPEEQQRWLKANLCIHCGSSDHFVRHCPMRPKVGAHP